MQVFVCMELSCYVRWLAEMFLGTNFPRLLHCLVPNPHYDPHFFLRLPPVVNVELPLTLMSSQWSQTTSLGCMTSLTLANTSRASPTHILSRESGWRTDSVSSAFNSFPSALFLVLTFVDVFYSFYVMALSMSTNVLFL